MAAIRPLLAVLEPLIRTDGNHVMRELFVANFVSSFLHQAGFSQFALHVNNNFGQSITDTKTALHQATVVEAALQYLGLQTYTRRFVGIEQDQDRATSPSTSGQNILSLNAESSTGLSPDVDLHSPRNEMPFTSPGCNDCGNGPDTGDPYSL